MAYDFERFMIVLQIAKRLARENPLVLDNLYVQEQHMSPGMR